MKINEYNIQSVSIDSIYPMQSKDRTVFSLDVACSDGCEPTLMIGVDGEKEEQMGGIDKLKQLFSDVSYIRELVAKAKSGTDGIKIIADMILL